MNVYIFSWEDMEDSQCKFMVAANLSEALALFRSYRITQPYAENLTWGELRELRCQDGTILREVYDGLYLWQISEYPLEVGRVYP